MRMFNVADGAALFNNLGSILAGVSELLFAVGAGIGFVIRSRRNARRERSRAETAASVAAAETKRLLEARLEAQHTAQVDQYKTQVDELKQRLAQLIRERNDLLDRLLERDE